MHDHDEIFREDDDNHDSDATDSITTTIINNSSCYNNATEDHDPKKETTEKNPFAQHNDNKLDIIIGNEGQKNQLLLNDGDGGYSETIDLPGGDTGTFSIAAADVNGDKMRGSCKWGSL